MVALRPRMAFIFDIRRGNMASPPDVQGAVRAVGRSRRVSCRGCSAGSDQPGLTRQIDGDGDLRRVTHNVETSESLYVENVRAVVNHLTKTHGFSLSADDTLRLQHAYRAFYTYGPAIQYSSTRTNGRRGRADLSRSDGGDGSAGAKRSYLATEESFAYLKRFESDNLLVPVIGNFAGPKTLRLVASYLIERGATVSAFYVSNVEEYLRRDGTWKTFCANSATLPLDERSTFIRSVRGDAPGAGFRLDSELGFVAREVKSCDTN